MRPETVAALDAASPEARRLALTLLDEISRPMAVREVEQHLRLSGHSKSWSAKIANQLRGLAIIAITTEDLK